jgi:hypothetical protein
MAHRPSLPALFLLLALITPIGVPTSIAQSADPSTSRIYRLDRASTYQHGCFAPCMCPVLQSSSVRGVFRLTRTGFDGLFEHYAVTDLNWRVAIGTTTLAVTGSGTYRIGGEVARQHQLSLDLKVGDRPVEHYDSGLVVGGASFPAIDIVISIHGLYCLDTVFEVHARPLMRIGVAAGSIQWDAMPEATAFDLVQGDLSVLRQTNGDFSAATTACVANDRPGTFAPFTAAPPPGRAFWFLGREIEGSVGGTYDSEDAGQVGSSDAGIAASSARCP